MELIPGCRQNRIRFDPPRLLLKIAAAQRKKQLFPTVLSLSWNPQLFRG